VNHIDELEKRFEAAHLGYLSSSFERTKDVKLLAKKDKDSAREIYSRRRSISRSLLAIERTQLLIEKSKRDGALRNEGLEREMSNIRFELAAFKVTSFLF
jgi:hypothetical protein